MPRNRPALSAPTSACALIVALWGAMLVAPAFAAEPLLKPGQITESALLDALAPADDGVKSRSIRPTLTGPAGSQTTPPPASGRAGLLITFETGSAALTPETRDALDAVGKALASDRLAGFAFRIEGHADPRGGIDYNLRLSEERAQSVVSYLVQRHGLSAERLQPVGKGSSELLRPEQPTAPENRRVTIVTTR
jgi:outer membrane protein OmpA-like peptidoglycan-associated protein